jgi:hypothetical protein
MGCRVALAVLALSAALLGACGAGGGSASTPPPSRTAAAPSTNRDWPTFGGTPERLSASSAPTALTAARAARLRRRTVDLPGTVDSTPIYLHDVSAGGARRDVFVMTTMYGRTLAVDAASGAIVWTFTPPGYAGWAGTARITNASPVADRDRTHVFTASPDGRVHRLSLAGGREDPGGGHWPVSVTRDPTHEKLTSSLNLVGDRLIVATGGYVGDAPPYQGHVVALARTSGAILGVFNSLCADRHQIIQPSSCGSSDSAIWGRAGAVADGAGRLFVATGNGPYDGRRDFGDSVIELSADARRVLRHWTPLNQAQLNATDLDLGSISPVLVPGGVLQSGKEGRIAVLTRGLRQVQSLPNPGGAPTFTTMAVWRHGNATIVFATTGAGTAAYRWSGHRLHPLWSKGTGATSPLVVGGLLYLYDPAGSLVVRRALDGSVVARLPAGAGHWNSPVVGGGRVALPQGDANAHETTGVLNLYG